MMNVTRQQPGADLSGRSRLPLCDYDCSKQSINLGLEIIVRDGSHLTVDQLAIFKETSNVLNQSSSELDFMGKSFHFS